MSDMALPIGYGDLAGKGYVCDLDAVGSYTVADHAPTFVRYPQAVAYALSVGLSTHDVHFTPPPKMQDIDHLTTLNTNRGHIKAAQHERNITRSILNPETAEFEPTIHAANDLAPTRKPIPEPKAPTTKTLRFTSKRTGARRVVIASREIPDPWMIRKP